MKAQALMPGSLVQLADDYYDVPKGTMFKVVEVYTDTIFARDIEGTYEEMELPEYKLEPILLTPEIFKKNGFISRGSGWYIIPNTPRLDMGILGFGIDDGCGTGFSQMPNGDFVFFAKYVHEIQHCLRMVHIEREIVL